MTYLEILIRTTKREIRTLERQRRACGLWAAFLYAIVLLNMLRADGTYSQGQIFTVVLFALGALVWIIRSHQAHLLLLISRARKAELDEILNGDAPHLHNELRKDGGVTIYSSRPFDDAMPDDVEAEVSRALRREGRFDD